MKKTIKRISLAIVTLLFIFVGLIYFYRMEIKSYLMPDIDQVGTITVRVENDTCYIRSNLTVENKSFLKINIDTIKYKVGLFNKIYLKQDKFIGMCLQPHSKDTIDFSLKVPYKILIKDLKAERKKGDSASYSIDISLQYSTFLGKSEIPINKKAKIKIPQPPDIEIVKINYKKVRLRKINAEIEIKIINYSAVDLSIKELNFNMNFLSHGKLNGKYTKKMKIQPNATTTHFLPIEISPKNIARTFFDVIRNKDTYPYALTLNAILESTDPIKESFPIELSKKGIMEIKK